LVFLASDSIKLLNIASIHERVRAAGPSRRHTAKLGRENDPAMLR